MTTLKIKEVEQLNQLKEVLELLRDELNNNFGYHIGIYMDTENELLFSILDESDVKKIYEMRTKLTEDFKSLQPKTIKSIIKGIETRMTTKHIAIKLSKKVAATIDIEDDLCKQIRGALKGMKKLYSLVEKSAREFIDESVAEETRIDSMVEEIRKKTKYVLIEVINPLTTGTNATLSSLDDIEVFSSIIPEIKDTIKLLKNEPVFLNKKKRTNK